MDRSLEDIIRSKGPRKPGAPVRKIVGRVVDARSKIISRKRQTIKDARYKLAELARSQDARFKLERLKKQKRTRNPGPNRNGAKAGPPRALFTDATRQVRATPLNAFRISRNIDTRPIQRYIPNVPMEEEYIPAPVKPIVRSIKNDLSPLFSNAHQYKYYAPQEKSWDNYRSAANPEPRRSGILKRNSEPIHIIDDDDRMDDSLYRKMTQPRMNHGPVTKTQANGYRIVVSNLQSSVTGSDIHELFSDIGRLVESRLVRPGTAEVIYASLKDAQKAVDVYHNRQLDGQPMKCFLVNPKNSTLAKFGGMHSSRPDLPASSNSSVTPDISTFHKALFGRD